MHILAVATALVLIAAAAVGGRILLDQGRQIVLTGSPTARALGAASWQLGT